MRRKSRSRISSGDCARGECERCPMVDGYDCLGKIFRRVKDLVIFTDTGLEESFHTCSDPGIDCDEEGNCRFYFTERVECRNRLMREIAKMVWKQTKTNENPYLQIEGAYREGEEG